MRTTQTSGVLAAAVLLAAGFFGCFNTDIAPPTEAEIRKSDSVAAVGTATLDDVFEQMNSSQFEYGEDLTELKTGNKAFRDALKLNPDNNEARVGAALTSVLLALQSHRLKTLVNETMEADAPLSPGLTLKAPLGRTAVLGKLAATEFPEIHELQDAVADTLLPVLETAIKHLQAVYEDAEFSMTLTLDGEIREIDHGEIAVLLAGFKTLHALATLVLAYDYDFDSNGSYDYLDVIGNIDDIERLSSREEEALNTLTKLLKPGSPFLAVRSSWKTRLAKVDDEIREALDVLRAGLGSVKTETDPQSDDLLHLCSASPSDIETGCIGQDAFDSGLEGLDSARKYMSEPYPVPLGDTTLHVNIAAYFNIQDYKKMFPHYAFYDAEDWDEESPIFYFTTPGGKETGNIVTLAKLLDKASDRDWTLARTIDSLKPIIRWQDPTFQGLLPGVTEAKLWRIIELAVENAEEEDEGGGGTDIDTTFAKSSRPRLARRERILSLSSFFNPRFPLLLIGN